MDPTKPSDVSVVTTSGSVETAAKPTDQPSGPSSTSTVVAPDPVVVPKDAEPTVVAPMTPTEESTVVLAHKDGMTVGDLWVGFTRFVTWPFVKEHVNAIQGYLNMKEFFKVITAWLLTGGTAIGLLQALSDDLGQLLPREHLQYADVVKAGIVFVISSIGLTSALRLHMRTGKPSDAGPMVTTVTTKTEPLSAVVAESK